ncbi:MAG: phosphate acyltransferase PlsX [Planctomycetota bacterium]
MTGVRVAIDAMGGDDAPREIVQGAVLAASQLDGVGLVLVGRREEIRRELDAAGPSKAVFEIIHAEQVVEGEESPAEAFRKKPDSSIKRSVELLASGDCQAVVSAGSTGAAVAASTLLVKPLPGVARAGICVGFPTPSGPCTVIDVGANVQCKPANLLQYAVMANEFSRHVFGVADPRVGLLNVGTETKKGNELVRSTYPLLAASGLNFVGNVEGGDIHRGGADVVVCDGFVGNILLKSAEALAEELVRSALKDLEGALAGAVAGGREALSQLMERNDYAAYGGAPLLGVDGVTIICHGRSNARAISNAIRVAVRFVGHHVKDRIVEAIAKISS